MGAGFIERQDGSDTAVGAREPGGPLVPAAGDEHRRDPVPGLLHGEAGRPELGGQLLALRRLGARLGQLSEFSLLIAVLALERGLIGTQASYLIQLSTLLTFFASTYLVVLRYPTPIALSDELRRD